VRSISIRVTLVAFRQVSSVLLFAYLTVRSKAMDPYGLGQIMTQSTRDCAILQSKELRLPVPCVIDHKPERIDSLPDASGGIWSVLSVSLSPVMKNARLIVFFAAVVILYKQVPL